MKLITGLVLLLSVCIMQTGATASHSDINAHFGILSPEASSSSSGSSSSGASSSGSSDDSGVVGSASGGTSAPESIEAATKSYIPSCDLTAESSICLFGGEKMLLPDASTKGLVGRYTFDEAYPVDSSRNMNHGTSAIPPGPGRAGKGASASFGGGFWMEIPASKSLNLYGAFSISMWVFLHSGVEAASSQDCPLILQRDSRDGTASFALTYNGETGKLTGLSKGSTQVKVESKARLLPGQWTYIVLSREATGSDGSSNLNLFVNGILDASAPLTAASDESTQASPIFVGAAPDSSASCQVPVYIDDLELFSRSLDQDEIAAAAFPALLVEPGFAKLGCGVNEECTYFVGKKTCQEMNGGNGAYHLCSSLELQSGAYSVARTMGWIDGNSQVWSPISDEDTVDIGAEKTALCCASK